MEILTQKIASLKSDTHVVLDEAKEKRRKVEALTQKLESKEGKWDSEKARYVQAPRFSVTVNYYLLSDSKREPSVRPKSTFYIKIT
jgi:hypothetical protein